MLTNCRITTYRKHAYDKSNLNAEPLKCKFDVVNNMLLLCYKLEQQ